VPDDLPEVTIESRRQWRAWLAENHASAPGVWLTRYKKASGRGQVSYDDVVEEALCFGWVDSRPRSLDENRSQLLVTPRKPTSRWSRLNKQRVERLLAAGLMTPAGLAAVEVARRNGAWTALDDVEELAEPADLSEALDARPAARRHWDAFPRSTRRAILEWITAAKRPQTRATRIEQTATLAERNVRANQWRQPKTRP
jgi:uncharacterized protein YdeI (YjbR/CyaY-like superfamily)